MKGTPDVTTNALRDDPDVRDGTVDRKEAAYRDVFPKPALADTPGGEDESADTAENSDGDSRTQAERLLSYVEDLDLFHAPDGGTAYASFEESGITRTAAISSSSVGDLLRKRFYEQEDRPPNAQALQDARDVLRARARFEGGEQGVHLRVAERNGSIFVDLCDSDWNAVGITPAGWTVRKAEEVPVKFRRTEGMQPLPEPEQGGGLELLRKHLPVKDEDAFALLLAYLVQSLRPSGPYPILCLTGEQGSGKTTAARMIRSLVDPSHVPVRTRPRKERDLVVAADNGWMLAFDNLSGLPDWLSDAFCRLSTGGGFGTRRLYSNREEELFFALRPVILNGIDDLTTRGDLSDRAISLRLAPIEERKTEDELWADFYQDRPKILGALFDAVSTALQRRDEVQLERLPRMADFAEWVVAAEPALPVEEGQFIEAYTDNRQSAREEAVSQDVVASAIRDMLEEDGRWTGKTSTLIADLKPYLPDPEQPPRDYPSSYQAMGAHLRRIMPALRELGIERVDDNRERSTEFTLQFEEEQSTHVDATDANTPQNSPESPERSSRVQRQQDLLAQSTDEEGEIPF